MQRRRSAFNFVIGASRYGVHWPDLDEDLSGAGLLRGAPAPRRSLVPSSKEWTKGDVRRLRLRIGATVTAFADMLGVRRATASDWEHGKKGVSPMGQKLLDDLVERLDTGSNPGLDPVVIRGSTRDPEVKSPNDK